MFGRWQAISGVLLGVMAWCPLAKGQSLPIPGALASPTAVRVDHPAGPRTAASAVAATPPPLGAALSEAVATGGSPVSPTVPPIFTDSSPSTNPLGEDVILPGPPSWFSSWHTNPFDESGLLFSVEYLLMRPRRAGFDFAINDPGRDNAIVGIVESLNYELRSGVRPSIGYRIADTGWDVLAEYTYFRSAANALVTALPDGALYPTLARPGLISQVDFALANASLQYNTYDAVLGRRITVDDHFGMRLFGGFRWATIRQDEVLRMDGQDANLAYSQAQNAFDGFGLILGGEAVWAGWHGFHLYARGHGGLLTGRTSNPVVQFNDIGRSIAVNLIYEDRKVVPVASISLGGGWQYRFFSLRVGYELINYFGLIDQPRFTNSNAPGAFTIRSGDLSLEGFFAQMGFSF